MGRSDAGARCRRPPTSALPKTDRAAIYTTSGQNTVEFTDDIDKLQADLLLLRNRSISNGSPANQCPDISYYMADMILNKNDTQTLNLAAQEAVACMDCRRSSRA